MNKGNKMKGKIFNAQEVQSMIAGDKRMFREVIKPQPDNARQQFSTIASSTMRGESGKHRFVEVENLNIITHTKSFKCPYQVGQKIFCKESFDPEMECENEDDLDFRIRKYLAFKADFYPEDHCLGKWRPAQHMKQEHSRLFPVIKEIRVERLGEISRGDCMAEGCPFPNIAKETNPKEWFANYWNATHKKPEEKFEASPWVFVYTMEGMIL